jgi:hypothetical protein
MDYIGYKNSVNKSSYIGTDKNNNEDDKKEDIKTTIQLILSGAQFLGNLYNQFTAHPAADARDFIKNLKPKLASADSSYNRLALVIAGDTKINEKAKDVSARELVLWYRQNYPNDYMSLTADQKIYFNKYVENRAILYPQDINQIASNYINSQFTTTELNYNATPTQAASNIFSSVTSGKTNWVLYGAIGIGAILLLKYIKK